MMRQAYMYVMMGMEQHDENLPSLADLEIVCTWPSLYRNK
jgi:hypothetical protein